MAGSCQGYHAADVVRIIMGAGHQFNITNISAQVTLDKPDEIAITPRSDIDHKQSRWVFDDVAVRKSGFDLVYRYGISSR